MRRTVLSKNRSMVPLQYRRRHRWHQQYRSNAIVNRIEAKHPGVREFIEQLLHRRCSQEEISRRVANKFGAKISRAAISRFWVTEVRPSEEAEREGYRQAHAQARALIQEMKADPSLDAAKIAELMLANQIVKDRMKLAETDIMDLYKEQRERKKLELQRKALRLREKQTIQVVKKASKITSEGQLEPEVLRKIEEIYGITNEPPDAAPALSS